MSAVHRALRRWRYIAFAFVVCGLIMAAATDAAGETCSLSNWGDTMNRVPAALKVSGATGVSANKRVNGWYSRINSEGAPIYAREGTVAKLSDGTYRRAYLLFSPGDLHYGRWFIAKSQNITATDFAWLRTRFPVKIATKLPHEITRGWEIGRAWSGLVATTIQVVSGWLPFGEREPLQEREPPQKS